MNRPFIQNEPKDDDKRFLIMGVDHTGDNIIGQWYAPDMPTAIRAIAALIDDMPSNNWLYRSSSICDSPEIQLLFVSDVFDKTLATFSVTECSRSALIDFNRTAPPSLINL